MVIENLTIIPEELIGDVAGFIKFLQAVGVLFVLYLIWMVIRSVFTFKMNKMIKEIHRDVKNIKKKLKIKK